MKYGYLRVSTDKQNYERQLYVLQEYRLDKIYEEKISGTKKACGREQFELLLQEVKKGDVIYFESMSRMARSMQDLIDTTNYLAKDKQVQVVFIKENISVGGNSNNDAMTSLIFNIMGSFAQFERDLIADRTKQALQAKKAQGIKLGKPDTISLAIKEEIKALKQSKTMTYQQIADKYGIHKNTVARI